MPTPFQDMLKGIADALLQIQASYPLPDDLIRWLKDAQSHQGLWEEEHRKLTTGNLLSTLLRICQDHGWDPHELIVQATKKSNEISDKRLQLGRKLRVAILFGRFDPIHEGHLSAAHSVLNQGEIDEIWFMPCFEPTSHSTIATPEQRLEMCRIATQNEPLFRVSEYAIKNRFRGELHTLIKRLLSEEVARDDCDFRWILEQDSAERLYQWSNCSGLDRLLPFLILPQANSVPPATTAWYLNPPHRFLSNAMPSIPIRTAQVRRFLSEGDHQATTYLPPSLLEYLSTKEIYRRYSVERYERERKIAIYIDKFDPPTLQQRSYVEAILQSGFDEVVVCPLGSRFTDLDQFDSDPMHRSTMVTLAFRHLKGVSIDYDDISLSRFTSRFALQRKHADKGTVWHVLPKEEINQESLIDARREWEESGGPWDNGQFLLLGREEDLDPQLQATLLPKNHRWIPVEPETPSTEIRRQAMYGGSMENIVSREVNDYLLRHRVFRTSSRQRNGISHFQRPRLRIVADQRNLKSMELKKKFAHLESESPDIILVLGGDGTMLHAIREHWRERIPFVGLNTGHLGFLMNEHLPEALEEVELVTYSLPLLRVDCLSDSGERFWGLAFADVWLERAEGQAAWLRVDVDGETRVGKVVGDGMLIATAAGSSAYARAMGAIPVPLNTPTLTLAGSNIFQPRFWKPMALSDDSSITLASIDTVGKRPVRGFIDGNAMGIVREITVRRSLTAGVQIAFTKEFDPSTRLLRSMFPPEES